MAGLGMRLGWVSAPPGALGDAESAAQDSFVNGLLGRLLQLKPALGT